MKRIRLMLSILVASMLGCAALNGTAATAPQYQGAVSCSMQMLYCLGTGNSQAYCQAQYDQCCQTAGNDCTRPGGIVGERRVTK